jgi:hypothetical protein
MLATFLHVQTQDHSIQPLNLAKADPFHIINIWPEHGQYIKKNGYGFISKKFPN